MKSKGPGSPTGHSTSTAPSCGVIRSKDVVGDPDMGECGRISREKDEDGLLLPSTWCRRPLAPRPHELQIADGTTGPSTQARVALTSSPFSQPPSNFATEESICTPASSVQSTLQPNLTSFRFVLTEGPATTPTQAFRQYGRQWNIPEKAMDGLISIWNDTTTSCANGTNGTGTTDCSAFMLRDLCTFDPWVGEYKVTARKMRDLGSARLSTALVDGFKEALGRTYEYAPYFGSEHGEGSRT